MDKSPNYLMVEECWSPSSVITESKTSGEKEYFIEGIHIQSGIPNGNKRVYPSDIMRLEVQRFNKEFIDDRRSLGELGHPETPDINLERTSHKIVKLEYINSTDVFGKSKLIDTPFGNIAKTLVKEGIKLGVSSRGVGSTYNLNGVSTVAAGYRLNTIDIVSTPSAPGAFVNGIMEGREWIRSNGSYLAEETDILKRLIDRQTKRNGHLITEQMSFAFVDQIITGRKTR